MCTAAAQAYRIDLNITCLHTKWDSGTYTINTFLVFFFTSLPIIILPPLLLFLCFLISLHTCCLWHTCFPWEKRVKLEWRAKARCGRWRGGDRLSLFYTRPPCGSSLGFKGEVYPPTGQHWCTIKLKGGVLIKGESHCCEFFTILKCV